MTKVAVCGCGRMGSRVVEKVSQQKDMKLVALFDPVKKGETMSDVSILDPSELSEKLGEIDVLVDFTNPEASIQNAKMAAEKGVKLVIGTTGHSKQQLEELWKACGNTACLKAPNMSVGVNVFLKTAQVLAKYLGKDYEVEIVEAHHHNKKDAPSGTAVKLGQIVAEALGLDFDKKAIYGRGPGVVGERTSDEIAFHAIRGGSIVGDHTIMFIGANERIQLSEFAGSRDCFADGTVKAISFIASKNTGKYDMWDVLGLKD